MAEAQYRPIDCAMATLEFALEGGLTLRDVIELGDFAQSLADWDHAVCLASDIEIEQETT